MKEFVAFTMVVYLLAAGSVAALDDPDMVLYFPFEKFDGNTALDQSGKGHNGTIDGDVTLVDGGRHGKAARFGDGFIDLDGASFPEADIPKEAITLCAWVKCEDTGAHHAIFNARAEDLTWLIHPELRNNRVFRWILRQDATTPLFDIQAGAVEWDKWTHYAGVFDGAMGTLYVNGEKIDEAPAPGMTIRNDWGFGARIGRNVAGEGPDARAFTGLMDELYLWKRSLTQAEVNILMLETVNGFTAVSPVGNLTSPWGGLKVF